MSIYIIYCSGILKAQSYNFSDPYTDKINFTPAFSGLSGNTEANLSYSVNFFSDIYSVSVNSFFEKYKSGAGFLVRNNSFGNNAINYLSISGIYSYRININYKSFVNTGIRIGFVKLGTDPDKLIFSSQTDPFSGNVTNNTEEFFPSEKEIDLSLGSSYFSNKYRIGFSVDNADKIFVKNEKKYTFPQYSAFFGKIFSVSKSGVDNQILITPEIIFQNYGDFNRLTYSVHGVYNIFLTRFFLKHNLKFNTFESVVTIGVNLKKFRFTYSYGIITNKYAGMPVSNNTVSLKYIFKRNKKINVKNTIYCLNF